MRIPLVKFLLGRGLVLPRETLSGFLEWSLVRDVIRSLKINCVLDVGANVGQFAHNLRFVGYTGHILAFEPVAEAFALLSKDFARDPFWHGYNFALGSENGTQTLNVVVGENTLSTFHSFPVPNVELRRDQVEVKRLDSILDGLLAEIKEPRIFMKTDTEGYDVQVVQGTIGCIDRILALQSELYLEPTLQGMPKFSDAIALYEGLGFHLLGLTEIARNPRLGSIVAFDCVFARSPVNVR